MAEGHFFETSSEFVYFPASLNANITASLLTTLHYRRSDLPSLIIPNKKIAKKTALVKRETVKFSENATNVFTVNQIEGMYSMSETKQPKLFPHVRSTGWRKSVHVSRARFFGG